MTAEEAIEKIRELMPVRPEDAVDARIRLIEEHGDPDGVTPDDVCEIVEKVYVEQWLAINDILLAVESSA